MEGERGMQMTDIEFFVDEFDLVPCKIADREKVREGAP